MTLRKPLQTRILILRPGTVLPPLYALFSISKRTIYHARPGDTFQVQTRHEVSTALRAAKSLGRKVVSRKREDGLGVDMTVLW